LKQDFAFPDYPDVIETPKHFWYGAVDLPFAVGNRGGTKVEPLSDGTVRITKSFIAKSYQYSDSGLYDLDKPKTKLEK
jgi:hypothetical protein